MEEIRKAWRITKSDHPATRRSDEQPETRQLTYEGNPRDYELRTLEIEIETWLVDVINWLLVADLGWDLSLWFREALIRRARRAGWNVYTPRPSWPDGEKRVWKRKGAPYEVPQWEKVE